MNQRIAISCSGMVKLAIACVLVATPVGAHHILGVPHYNYDERYPQTPVLTYRAEVYGFEIEMTGYPGKPEPGQRCSLHVYIRDSDSGEVFDDVVALTVTHDRFMLSDPVIYGPMEARIEESMYKFFPEFDRVGNYELEVSFEAHGEPWVIVLPMVVGEPSSPWAAIGMWGGGIAALLLIGRAIRIKMKRRAPAVTESEIASVESTESGQPA